MLKIEDASIAYGGIEIFSGLDIDINKGEIVCVSGESGSGKTSLINAILGFIPLNKGEIIVDGLILSENTIEDIRKKIAWIPQELALPCEWVSEMVKLPFELKSNRGIEFSIEGLFEAFKQMNLDEKLYNKRVNEISGGQRQRIMIAVAALLKKPLLIVDEPTSALDSASGEKVLNFLISMAQQGTTVLAVSHDRTFKLGSNRVIYL